MGGYLFSQTEALKTFFQVFRNSKFGIESFQAYALTHILLLLRFLYLYVFISLSRFMATLSLSLSFILSFFSHPTA